jgi:hypothetical protein
MLFKDPDGDASKAPMSSFLADAAKVGAVVQGETTVTTFANDIVEVPDDPLGSTLFSALASFLALSITMRRRA